MYVLIAVAVSLCRQVLAKAAHDAAAAASLQRIAAEISLESHDYAPWWSDGWSHWGTVLAQKKNTAEAIIDP